MEVNKTLFASLLSAGLFLASAVPTFAGGTFFVNSVTGNDANNCTSAATPCLTVAAAKALIVAQLEPENSTLKLAGTIADPISFTKSDVTAPKTLDGLRITSTDANAPVFIDGTGEDLAVSVTSINRPTIDHLIVANSATGIYVSGSNPTYIVNASIHHNDIYGLNKGASYYVYGIQLRSAKQSNVHHNTIHDVALSEALTAGYNYVYGIYAYDGNHIKIQHNTVQDFTVTNAMAAVGTHSQYVYGIYGTTLTAPTVSNNTISNLAVTETSTLAGTSQYVNLHGIYMSTSSGVKVQNNRVNALHNTVSADFASTVANSGVYGIYVQELRASDGMNLVKRNRITDASSMNAASSVSSTMMGIRFDYIYSVNVNHNTVNGLTSTPSSSIANANLYQNIYGFYSYLGSDVTVQHNVARALVSNPTFSSTGIEYSSNLHGIALSNVVGTLKQNTISTLTHADTTNNQGDTTSYLYTYGIEASTADRLDIVRNTVQDFNIDHASSGAGNSTSASTYGIQSAYTNALSLSGNVIKDITLNLAETDVTNSSGVYGYNYGIALRLISTVDAENNMVKDSTFSFNGGDDNYVGVYNYGIQTNGVDGIISKNSIVNLNYATTSNQDAYNTTYAMSLAGNGATLVNRNLVKKLVAGATGATASNVMYGVYIAGGHPITVNANQIRELDGSSTNINTIYGISWSADASDSQLYNNVLVGKDQTSTQHIGLHLPSDSTTNLEVTNNTFVNFTYPVWLKGGNKLKLYNNILSANDTGYPLAWAGKTVNENLDSDYNLFYTALGNANAVYDTDAATAVHFGDWTNKNGSWGYDQHSVFGKPNTNASGRLKPGSKAINNGTAVTAMLLQSDINQDKRPNKGAVDIGADEL